MSRSAEAWAEQQEQDQQAQESEAELYYSILDAIQQAKDLGLPKDQVQVLCYASGVDSDYFYKDE
jgi:hypothetical protein